MTTPPRHQPDGFTLIELLLSVTILTIIMAALTTALIVFFENGRETLERDDHSGGAAIFSSYLDRDVASADTVSLDGSTCSGSTNIVLLTWRDYVATTLAPSPAPVPAAQAYQSAYTVVVDAGSVPADGTARYKLQRVLCQGSTELERSTLVPNLTSASTKATAALVTDLACTGSSQALTFVLASYFQDTTDPFTFRACTKTRLTP